MLPISSLHLLTKNSKSPRVLLEDKWVSKSYTLWFFVKELELFIGVGAKGVFEFLEKGLFLGWSKAQSTTNLVPRALL